MTNVIVPTFLWNVIWLDCSAEISDYKFERASGVLKEDLGGLVYVRKTQQPEHLYVVDINNNEYREQWTCFKCKSSVRFAIVTHPIINRNYPFLDRLRHRYEVVPYCPICEQKPDLHGGEIKI